MIEQTRIEFEDDTVLEFPSNGAYNTAQYSRVNTVCEDEPIEEADKAARLGMVKVFEDGELIQKRGVGLRSRAKLERK